MLIAYCWAGGLIEFGTKLPAGAIEIARGKESIVRKHITATARVSKDGTQLLVPGVPEAQSGDAAVDAVVAHATWLKGRETPSFRVNARSAS